MDVIDIISFASSQTVEIKLEDIESDPENPVEQTQNSSLNSQEADKITSKNLNEFHSETDYDSGDEDFEDSSEDEEFQYVCNTINESVEVVNISEMGNSEQIKEIVQIKPHDNLTGKTNSAKIVRRSQNIEKPLDTKATLLIGSKKVGNAVNRVQSVVNSSQIRTVPFKPDFELTQKTYEKAVQTLLNESKKDGDNLNISATKYLADPKVHDDEIVKKDQGYQCVYCSYFSANWPFVKHHVRSHHRITGSSYIRKRTCRQCPYCPVQSVRLDGHIYNCHTEPEDISWYPCSHCDYKAKMKHSLANHIMAKHTDPSLYEFNECKECGKKFRNLQYLNNHVKRIHHPEQLKRYKCDYCPYSTPRQFRLKNHMSHHVSFEKGFKCSKCSFTAKKANELTKHQMIEHLEWLQCHICAYKCPNNFRLKLHLIRHQEKKEEEDLTYKCQNCDYKTCRRHNLTVHMLKHKKLDEIEMFQCYHCNFKTKRKKNLKAHIFKHDLYKTILDCFICSFKTRSKYELKKHVDAHSEEQKKEAEKIKLSIKRKLMNEAETKKHKSMDEGMKRTKKNDENVNKTRNILNDTRKKSQKSQKKSEGKKLLRSKEKTLEQQQECNKVINKSQILVGDCTKMNENENQESVVENRTKHGENQNLSQKCEKVEKYREHFQKIHKIMGENQNTEEMREDTAGQLPKKPDEDSEETDKNKKSELD